MTGWINNPAAAGGGRRGVLSPYGANTPIGQYFRHGQVGYSVTATTWTANRAVFQPVLVEYPVTITDFAVYVTTQAGNLDVGLYTLSGTLIVSNGGVATGAAGPQTVTCADTAVGPGWYQLGFSCNSAVAAFRTHAIGVNVCRPCGYQQQASAYPLPSPTATFATYTTSVAPLVLATYRAIV